MPRTVWWSEMKTVLRNAEQCSAMLGHELQVLRIRSRRACLSLCSSVRKPQQGKDGLGVMLILCVCGACRRVY